MLKCKMGDWLVSRAAGRKRVRCGAFEGAKYPCEDLAGRTRRWVQGQARLCTHLTADDSGRARSELGCSLAKQLVDCGGIIRTSRRCRIFPYAVKGNH